ncbi:MAG: hypothetical protein JXQ29_00280 [Planctomycetes bacterium]|nr:hypothetical protein [Planctomycetota bacterium]
MNTKTVFLNASLGVAAGFLILLSFKQPMFCCCSTPFLLVAGGLLGSFLAPLLHGFALRPGAALVIGGAHGIVFALAAVAALWFGLFQLTSDETLRTVLSGWQQQMVEFQRAAEKAAEDQPEEQRKTMQDSSEQVEELLARAQEDPRIARHGALVSVVFCAAVLCVLAGLLGGYFGSVVFRQRLRPPASRPAPDDERMHIPEETDRWWEKEK